MSYLHRIQEVVTFNFAHFTVMLNVGKTIIQDAWHMTAFLKCADFIEIIEEKHTRD